MKYICIPCGYLYDEQAEDTPLLWSQISDQWQCPDCGTAKGNFAELDLELSQDD